MINLILLSMKLWFALLSPKYRFYAANPLILYIPYANCERTHFVMDPWPCQVVQMESETLLHETRWKLLFYNRDSANIYVAFRSRKLEQC